MNRREFSVLAGLAIAGLPTARALAAGTPGATVRIKNFAFVPPALTVRAGTTVVFVNDDDEPHTATATDKSFDSEAIETKASWTHTFTKAGATAYFCELHPQMKGRVVVTAAGTGTP